MKIRLILSIMTFAWCGAGVSLDASESGKEIHVRVAAYNVEFGKNASPEEIGRMFKPYNLDIIGFNEVPDGDWTARVGRVLGMKHTYVGKISSANHKDKYKSILSSGWIYICPYDWRKKFCPHKYASSLEPFPRGQSSPHLGLH